MANLGLAILSGLLGGAGGFLKEGAAAGKADEELALRKQADARGERADAETRRSNAAKEAAGVVSDPQRYDPGLPAGPIPIELLKILLPAMAKAKAETEDRTQAQALGREFDREATPPRENVADERTDPGLSALARMIPLLNAAGRAKIVEDQYKVRDPKPLQGETRTIGDRQVRLGYDPASQREVSRTDVGPATEKPERTLAERYAEADLRLKRTAKDDPMYPQALKDFAQAKLGFENELKLQAARPIAAAEVKLTQPLSPSDAGALGMPYGTTPKQAAAMGPAALTATQRSKMDAMGAVSNMLDTLEKQVAEISAPSGPAGRLLAIPQALWNIQGQADPKLAALHSRLQGAQAQLIRAMGEVGTFTDQDNERAKALNIRIAPIPDTKPVMQAKIAGLRQLFRDVAGGTGTRPVTLGGAGVRPPPAPSAGAPAPPSGKTQKWIKDASGKYVPGP